MNVEQKPTNGQGYNFESQLDLGELMLKLGRIDDAYIELKKAKELNDIGSFSTPSNSPQREIDLLRLETALVHVNELYAGTQKRSLRLLTLAILIVLLLLVGMFVVWTFNRSRLISTTTESTRVANQIATQQADLERIVNLANMENTRTVREIVDQKNEIATVSAERENIAAIAQSRGELATAEAINTLAAETVSALEVMIGSATPTPRPPLPTHTPEVPIWDQLRVTYSSGNIRSGPGTNFRIVTFVYQRDVLDLLATNEEGNWYNVRTTDGVIGWIHPSLVQSLAMQAIPVAATIPPSPVPLPTAVPEGDEIAEPSPTFTPEPTAIIPPSATPTPTPAPTNTPTSTPSSTPEP